MWDEPGGSQVNWKNTKRKNLSYYTFTTQNLLYAEHFDVLVFPHENF